jgi:hypothetical protein
MVSPTNLYVPRVIVYVQIAWFVCSCLWNMYVPKKECFIWFHRQTCMCLVSSCIPKITRFVCLACDETLTSLGPPNPQKLNPKPYTTYYFMPWNTRCLCDLLNALYFEHVFWTSLCMMFLLNPVCPKLRIMVLCFSCSNCWHMVDSIKSQWSLLILLERDAPPVGYCVREGCSSYSDGNNLIAKQMSKQTKDKSWQHPKVFPGGPPP